MSIFRRYRDYLIISISYTLSFGLSLINFGVFWDDWAYVGQPLGILVRNGMQLGIPWLGYFQYLFTSSAYGIFLCRLCVFFSFLASGFCLYFIVRSIKEILPSTRLLICLFFCIFPLHFGRMLICVSHYAICFFAFFLALALTVVYLKKPHFLLRLLILLLFFFSFFTNSLLVFHAITLAVIYYHNYEKKPWTVVIRFCDFIVLPIIFFVARHFWFRPFGIFEGYNGFSIKSLLLSIIYLPLSFKSSFLDTISLALTCLPLMSLVVASLAVFWVMRCVRVENSDLFKIKRFFMIGLCIFICGVTPYILVGKPPMLVAFESRHQLLLGLGNALMLTYFLIGIRQMFKLKHLYFIALVSIIMASFISFNIYTQLEYHRELAKQDALLIQLRSTPELTQFNTIIFEDTTLSLNAWGRKYSFYEFTQLLSLAFGKERYLGLDHTDMPILPKLILRKEYEEYGFKQWQGLYPAAKVVILSEAPFPSIWQLIGANLFFKDAYMKKLSTTLSLSVTDP